MNFAVITNLSLLSLPIIFLIWYRHRAKSLSSQVFTAMFCGIFAGFLLHSYYEIQSPILQQTLNYLSIIGLGYIRLLQMVIMPLILVSIIAAIIRVDSGTALKKIGLTTIALLLGTTAIAACISIGVANLMHLDAAHLPNGNIEILRAGQVQNMLHNLNHDSVATLILNFIPENIFFDLTGARATSTIAVVIISSLLGLSLLKLRQETPEKAAPAIELMDSLQAVVMRLVKMILALTPFGVYALMTKVMANSDLGVIINLLQFITASYIAIALMMIIHLLLVAMCGISPIDYLRKAFSALAFAFTSRSSAGTIPLNVETQIRHFNVPSSIANFSASFGATIGQNGCAGIYPSMLAIMVAPTVGIDPSSIHFILMLVVVTTISSLGVAGVGGGATFAALIVLSTMNLPVTIVALLISIEPLIDMARTMLNVNGAMTAGIVSSRLIQLETAE